MSVEPSRDDILSDWDSYPMEKRDELMEKIQSMNLYPRIMNAVDEWESEAGLYPDTEDPRFAEKLMRKQEFAENKQDTIAQQEADGVNPCDPDKEFELSPVQRFIGRFLSPQCPYQSALLYHGVGVGKTCAAITVAENYLRAYPRRQVIIVAPRNIQPGFRRTIFDDEALKFADDDFTPNMAKGCTGNTYLKRTGTEFERDPGVLIRRINQSINSRYLFLGYIQFHRMIEELVASVPKTLAEDVAEEQRARILRRHFSGRLIVIDEAHNLRDSPGESADDDADNPGGDAEVTESQAGKKLTPSLIRLLKAANGMKLLLMSGTPMYNSYKEIIFLLNLLLINDKKVELSERDIFVPATGDFVKERPGKRSGEELLGAAANAYVSFMRGENPLSFPVRLPPEGTPVMAEWPVYSPDAKEIPTNQRDRMKRLPFVPVSFEGASAAEYLNISEESIEAGGLGVKSIDEMVQAGNWLFPSSEGVATRDSGFDGCFEDSGSSGSSQYRSADPSWLQIENLGTASPKAKLTLERIQKGKGIAFIYSRFIKSGALPLALALEANGYTAWGDDRKQLLLNGHGEQGRQCALCEKREKAHQKSAHKFTPAKYILITGRANLSPNNTKAIQAARAKTNIDGREVKVIIGSQVASEGIDFRFVREIYVFDSWFHLNKMEQVLGRGIRTCSHSLMKPEERNCTIHLLVNRFSNDETETADLYMYRTAMSKAMRVGRVTRVLKRYALDCNLNRDAIVVAGLDTQRHVDSQGGVREQVNINDTPFTNVCDWIETCEYTCAKRVDINMDDLDQSTYDEYAVRWRESELKSTIKKLFQEREQPVFQLEEILEQMSAVPPKAISGLLSEVIGNRSFRLQMPVGKTGRSINGYIVYRNGYYMFQPDYLVDIRIPLALRVAEVPVKRDSFDATQMQLKEKPSEMPRPAEPGPVQTKDSLVNYWESIKVWADNISSGEAPKEDMPLEVQKAIAERYSGDTEVRENDQLIMLNWLYDSIQSGDYGEKKNEYLQALSEVLIEMVWDESIKPTEQLKLIAIDPVAKATAEKGGQIVVNGGTTATRIVDIASGSIKYYCGEDACSTAVTRIFEADTADPLHGMEANNKTTGSIYGFMVPKGKEGRVVFKTNDRPVPPGTKPEKGSECSIVSTISFHIRMLKDIAELMESEEYPKFLLIDEFLDEKMTRRRLEDEAKAQAKAEGRKYEKGTIVVAKREGSYGKKGDKPFKTRTFENAIRACALKDIILRWIDNMQKQKGRRRYFYRPIEALKTNHKGSK
jgi:hypothetical protein